MNDKQLAAEVIQKEVTRLKGLIAAGEMFQRVGNLEQTEKELRATIDTQERTLEALKGKQEEAIDGAAKEMRRSQALREENDAEEKRLSELAALEMGKARDAAKKEGEKILASVNQTLKELQAKVATQESRLVEVNKEIAVKEFKLSALNREMAELTKKHLG